MNNHSGKEPVLAALFVDFDNVFISLEKQQGKEVASQFAANPDKWLNWLEHSLPEGTHRRILVRRCYLNPQSFAESRPFFIRSAFEVVDCPPLTRGGKTSTDIHLVMDVLDTLNHSTHFQEFIIFSGDSDFTPVLLRLRMHNRRTVVLTAGFYVSPAYKSSCDYVISSEEFIREALGIGDTDEEEKPAATENSIPKASKTLLTKMARKIHEAAVLPQGIEASELPKIYGEFPEFKQSEHWLGFRSLRSLTEAIINAKSDLLTITGDDPWRVSRRADQLENTDNNARQAIAVWIQKIVSESPSPVTMASLAGGVTQYFGPDIRNSNWLGAETFKGLLNQLDLGELKLLATIPGYVYDPRRHNPEGTAKEEQPGEVSPITAPAGDFSVKHPELAQLAWKINQLTDTPYLMPEHYSTVLLEIAREINENGNYQWTRTSKTVRDRCVEKGIRVARSHVNFILTGVLYSGYQLGKEIPVDPAKMAAKLIENTITLCRNAQFQLSESDIRMIQAWITPGSESDETEPTAPQPDTGGGIGEATSEEMISEPAISEETTSTEASR